MYVYRYVFYLYLLIAQGRYLYLPSLSPAFLSVLLYRLYKLALFLTNLPT